MNFFYFSITELSVFKKWCSTLLFFYVQSFQRVQKLLSACGEASVESLDVSGLSFFSFLKMIRGDEKKNCRKKGFKFNSVKFVSPESLNQNSVH